MSETTWLIVALIIVTAFIGGYAFYLEARRRRLSKALKDLEPPG